MRTRLQQLLSPPTFSDEKLTRQTYILNIVLLTTLGVVLAVSATYILPQQTSGTGSDIITYVTIRLLIGIVVLYAAMRARYIRPAAIGIVILFLWFSYFMLSLDSDLDTVLVYTAVLPIILASTVIGAQATITTAVAVCLLFLYIQLGNSSSFGDIFASWLPYTIGITLITALLLRLSANMLDDTIASLNSTNHQLQQLIRDVETRIYEKTRDLELAADIGRHLAQVRNVELLLADAVENVRNRFDLYYAQIYLIDAAGKNLVLRAGTGTVGQELKARSHTLPLNANSINGMAAINQQAIIVNDTKKNAMFRPNHLLPLTRSEMAVPLIVNDKVVGVLDLQSSRIGALSLENLKAFQILAGQLSIAIENARLIRNSDRIRRELEQNSQGSIRQEWDRYLDAIHRGERVGYVYEEGELLALQDATTESVNGRRYTTPITIAGQPVGTLHLDHDANTTLSKVDMDLVQAVTQQISQQIENLRLLEEAEQYRSEAEEATHRQIREGWQVLQGESDALAFYYDQVMVQPLTGQSNEPESDFVEFPLDVRGATIGKLEITGVPVDDPDTQHFLTLIGNQLSGHLENLRLSAQTEVALAQSRQRSAELDILNEMGKALTVALDENEIIRQVYHYVSQLMDTSSLYIALYDKLLDEIQIYLFYGNENARPGDIHGIIKRQSGNGITEYVLRSGQPLLIDRDFEATAQKLGFEAIGKTSKIWLGVPMMVGDEHIGVISVQSFTDAKLYDEHHLDLLTAVASQTAISIQNTRLFRQTQTRARQEQILREVTARVHSAVDAQSVLKTAAQEISRTLGVDAFIYLEDQLEQTATAAADSNGRGTTAS